MTHFTGTGRNSGVIHSGIYYPPDTLRAKYCVSGSKQLKLYVKEKNLWIDECGKILLPTKKNSIENIEILLDRAKKNGIDAKKVSYDEIKKLEPLANPLYKEGIYIPFTSVVNPTEVAFSLKKDLEILGVDIFYQKEVTKINSHLGEVYSHDYCYKADTIINSAGLHADNVSKLANFKSSYSFLPFKCKYWEVNKNIKMKKLLYPIPDLNLPFLGVHTVHNQNGQVFLGPSSTPVFGRENYNGIKGLNFLEAFFLFISFAKKILFNTNGIRSLAIREMKLFSLRGVSNEAKI